MRKIKTWMCYRLMARRPAAFSAQVESSSSRKRLLSICGAALLWAQFKGTSCCQSSKTLQAKKPLIFFYDEKKKHNNNIIKLSYCEIYHILAIYLVATLAGNRRCRKDWTEGLIYVLIYKYHIVLHETDVDCSIRYHRRNDLHIQIILNITKTTMWYVCGVF